MQTDWFGAFSAGNMCGIYGFAGFQEDGLLEKMGQAIRHRGPNGLGSFVGRGERSFAMGVRRLFGAAGAAGEGEGALVFSEDRTVVVVKDGVIYNADELAAELRERGHLLTGSSDEEVLVHGYEEWGLDGVLARVNGMFAMCLHDAKTGDFFLVRDRCGQKPLYYTAAGGRFLFASEIKALLQSVHVEARPNIRAIDPYLMLGHVPGPQTMFSGIFALPAAHYLRCRADGAVEVCRWWEIRLRGGVGRVDDGDEAYYESFEARWGQAVRHCVGGVSGAGVYLDGGIDSALTAAAMVKHGAGRSSYGLGFGGGGGASAAAETAAALGLGYREVRMTAEDFRAWPEVVWHLDQPVSDPLAIAGFLIARRVAADGKIVMGGAGANELFGGSEFHAVMMWAEGWRRLVPGVVRSGLMLPGLKLTPGGVWPLFSRFSAGLGRSGKRRLYQFLKNYDQRDLNHNCLALRTLWAMDERRDVYADEFKSLATDAAMASEGGDDRSGPFLDRVLKSSYGGWLEDCTLLMQDKTAMAQGVEYRNPFLDHRLIELVFTMPPHLKMTRWTDKVIERRLADVVLPKNVARRVSRPPQVPSGFFFDQPEFRTLVAETLNAGQLKKRGYFNPKKVTALIAAMNTTRDSVLTRQVVSLVTLELWHRVFIDHPREFGTR